MDTAGNAPETGESSINLAERKKMVKHMIRKTAKRFLKTHSQNNRSVFRRSAFMVLTIAFFAAGTLKADLINVTSVSDFVRIKDVNVPFAKTAHSSNLSGNALERTIGSGEFETGAIEADKSPAPAELP